MTEEQRAMHKLTIPAPRRDSYRTESGWASRPWSSEARAEYELLAGAVFDGTQEREYTSDVRATVDPKHASCRCTLSRAKVSHDSDV